MRHVCRLQTLEEIDANLERTTLRAKRVCETCTDLIESDNEGVCRKQETRKCARNSGQGTFRANIIPVNPSRCTRNRHRREGLKSFG